VLLAMTVKSKTWRKLNYTNDIYSIWAKS